MRAIATVFLGIALGVLVAMGVVFLVERVAAYYRPARPPARPADQGLNAPVNGGAFHWETKASPASVPGWIVAETRCLQQETHNGVVTITLPVAMAAGGITITCAQ